MCVGLQPAQWRRFRNTGAVAAHRIGVGGKNKRREQKINGDDNKLRRRYHYTQCLYSDQSLAIFLSEWANPIMQSIITVHYYVGVADSRSSSDENCSLQLNFERKTLLSRPGTAVQCGRYPDCSRSFGCGRAVSAPAHWNNRMT